MKINLLAPLMAVFASSWMHGQSLSDSEAVEALQAMVRGTNPRAVRAEFNESGTVRSLSVSSIRPVREADVPGVITGAFADIEELRLYSGVQGGAWVGDLRDRPRLRALLVGGDVRDPFLAAVRQLSQLTHLDIQSNYTDDAGWASLSGLKQLESLRIRVRNPRLSDNFLDAVRGLEGLREFVLSEMVVEHTRSLVAFVAAHPSLERVTLSRVESQHDLLGALRAVRPDLQVSMTPMEYITWIKWLDWPYGR